MIQTILAWFRPSSRYTLPPKVKRVAGPLLAGLAVYHVASPMSWLVPVDAHLAIHLSAVLAISFLLLSPSHGEPASFRPLDLALVGLALLVGVYFVSQSEVLLERAVVVTPLSTTQIAAAAALVLLTLEATRRAVGLPFVLIIAAFLLLMNLGPHLPGIWSHPGMDLVEILDHIVWSPLDGLWGIPLRMSATIIALFFIFGKLMQHSGMGILLTSICEALAGGSRGGPAKVAVIGSALVGSLTGGPVTNIIMTGSLTIPMMKKTGYKPHYAAAIEAAASTGASLVPPVMISIVFIMAELTGTPYVRLMLIALIPAALYYSCLIAQVHLQAVRTGIRATGIKPDIRTLVQELRTRGHLLVPMVVLVALLIDGHYPATVAMWSIPLVPLVAALRSETRMGPRRIAVALQEASQELIRVAPVCALGGVIIIALFQTGLGSTFSHVASSAAGNSLLLLVLIGAAACLLMGTGTPPIAAYLMTVLIVAPLMIGSGIPVLVAHFFSLYYSILAFIIPPIAVGALVASGIAGAGFWSTSITAVRLAIVGFVVPLAFVYRPALLLYGGPVDVAWALAASAMLVFCLATASEGWILGRLRIIMRLLLVTAGFLMIPPNLLLNSGGLVIVVAVALSQLRRLKSVLPA